MIPFGRFWLLLRALPHVEARVRVNDTRSTMLGAAAAWGGKDGGLSKAMQDDLKDAYLGA